MAAESPAKVTQPDLIESLKARTKQQNNAAGIRWRRDAIAQPSLLVDALHGGAGGTQRLAAAAAQNVPLQLQLLLPLLLVLLFFGIVSMMAYNGGWALSK